MLKLRFSFSFLNIDKKPRYRDPFFIIPTDAQENSLIFRVKQFKKYLLDFSQYRFEVQKKNPKNVQIRVDLKLHFLMKILIFGVL